MTDTKTEKVAITTPPYLPFLTVKNFVESLKNTAVPAVVDRSVMPTLSGAMQKQLLAALKFLKLIGPNGETAESLHKLVKAFDTPAWGEELGKAIDAGYATMTKGIDLRSASSKTLNDGFSLHGGVDGQMLDKCVRFYLKALQSTGRAFSPHFKTRKGTPGKRTGVARPAKAKASPQNSAEVERVAIADDVPPAGTIMIPIYLPGKPHGRVIVPEDLSESDCQMIDDFLRAYAKRRHEKAK